MTAALALTDVAVGTTLPARTFPLQRLDLVRYAGASGDHNVIHWDETTARAVGLPDVIAHGMLTMATAGRVLTDWVGDPAAVLAYAVRFSSPVVVPHDGGAVLAVEGVVTAVDPAARTATVTLTARAGGTDVLGAAEATVRLA